ncbi:MAG: hypothetical protein VKK42_14515 [Lyngbya sp.]|nr:hypothetical protein [Lyngbya sp.]
MSWQSPRELYNIHISPGLGVGWDKQELPEGFLTVLNISLQSLNLYWTVDAVQELPKIGPNIERIVAARGFFHQNSIDRQFHHLLLYRQNTQTDRK